MFLRSVSTKIVGIVTNIRGSRTRRSSLRQKERLDRVGALLKFGYEMVFSLCVDGRGYRSRLRPRPAAHFAHLGNRLAGHLTNRHAFVLDVVLFVQAIFLIELFHLAGHDFFYDRLGFARGPRLRAVNLALLLAHLRSHLLAPHVSRVERRDVHSDVVTKLLERLRARHEVRLAVDFHEHSDLSARVDVTAHESLARFTLCFLCGGRLPLSAQNTDRLLDVSTGFDERRAAIGEPRVGSLAQLLHQLCWYLNRFRFCAHTLSLLKDVLKSFDGRR